MGSMQLQLARASWADFAEVSRAKQQRVLTRAAIDVRRDRWKADAEMRDLQVLASGSCEGDRPGAGDWLLAVPEDTALMVSDDVYAHAMRMRLGIPTAMEGDCCAVYIQTSRSTCGRPLTRHADHAHGCARAARNAGHNHVRDWFAGVLREAGGRALTEQWVTEYAPRKHVRADVWSVPTPGAGVTYFDVVISHPFTTGVPTGSVGQLLTQRAWADAAIGPATAGKYTKYAPPQAAEGQAAIPCVNMVPLAFDTHGRWGEEAVRSLRAAARRRLARADARQSASKHGMYARLLQRWRAAGAIAVQRRNFDVWRDCVGNGLGVGIAEEAGYGGTSGLLQCLLSSGCMRL